MAQEEIVNSFQSIFNENGRKVAVFDADGTIWSGDVSELFFQYLIENKIKPDGITCEFKQILEEYKCLHHIDSEKAVALLLQVFSGVKVETYCALARKFFIDTDFFYKRVFSPIFDLIKNLYSNDFEIWICSASSYLLISELVKNSPLMQYIPIFQILAVESERSYTKFPIWEKFKLSGEDLCIDNSNIAAAAQYITPTMKQIPIGPSKSTVIERVISVQPMFGIGNSFADSYFMSLCKYKLAVSSVTKIHPEEHASEAKLASIATEKNWFHKSIKPSEIGVKNNS